MWNGLMSFVQRCHARALTFELKREEGQAMVEYGLIVALISIAAVSTFTPIGKALLTTFETVEKTL